MREGVLDLVFLVGVLVKGLDGLVEVIGGVVLLLVSPGQLLGAAQAMAAGELLEDPDDLLVNLVLHGIQGLQVGTEVFLAVYLLAHGLVKLLVVAALLRGTRRVYPWVVAVLVGFLAYQGYQLIVAPTVVMVALTVLDLAVVVLTWREWRHGRLLRQTMRSTRDWLVRRKPD
jgi:uncharacterized membrane protein